MDPIERFKKERQAAISAMGQDEDLKKKSLDWMIVADKYLYTYNYTWLGRPIIKYPNDIVASQEIIWSVKPDLIVETGIAHGGSAVFSASMLQLLGRGRVVAVDIDIRKHNRVLIEQHPMCERITMLQGSSIDPEIVRQVAGYVKKSHVVMVFLDSSHTHDHVLQELRLYSPFVTVGSYMVLPDTFVELFPRGHYKGKPVDVGNNPMTALRSFMKENDNFVIDTAINDKLCITEGFDGYLKRVK
jgi:cephalosporin hydroxylase